MSLGAVRLRAASTRSEVSHESLHIHELTIRMHSGVFSNLRSTESLQDTVCLEALIGTSMIDFIGQEVPGVRAERSLPSCHYVSPREVQNSR
jgi:hypothetical protein